jgi:hypothetical protein
MADQLASPADVGVLLGISDLEVAKAALLVEIATALVQDAAGGQRIVAVAGEEITLTGTTDAWLDLPQLPVTAVTAVELDGVALTAGAAGSGGSTYRLRGSRLWRGDGWQTYVGEPSEVTVTYSHGYPALHQGLQLGRAAVLGLIRGAYDNPEGRTSVKVDDYSAAYDALSARMETSPHLRAGLRRTYGRRAGSVRTG